MAVLRFYDEKASNQRSLHYDPWAHVVTLPLENIFIAPKRMILTDARMVYGTLPSKPAPVLWMKTGASKSV